MDLSNCKITLVGTGMIGSGLAVNAMLHGHPVTLYDVVPPEKVQAGVRRVLDTMVTCGAATREDAETAFGRSSYTTDLAEAITGASFIQECLRSGWR